MALQYSSYLVTMQNLLKPTNANGAALLNTDPARDDRLRGT
jgi:hypothetical protein